MSPIINWIERSFKSRHISRGLVLIRGLNGIPIYLRFRFTFWQGSAIKEVPKCLGTTYKSKICQEPNNIFFCSFLCKFFSSLCGNYRRMKWAVALLVWEDKNYSPLLASYFQNEKLFCDILIHLGPHTSPKSCSIQIVFEQKHSFLHDVYLTNIWIM